MTEPGGELILYRSDDGASVVQLRASGGTVWLLKRTSPISPAYRSRTYSR
jgi:hypothetical protein